MPNLNTFHTLHDRVVKYQEENGIEKVGEAFDRVALEIILNLNEDEIEDAITDGGDEQGADDGGIDAIHINDREVHIFSFTYTNKFENTSKNFPQNKIDKFIVTVAGIITKNLQREAVNELIWEKAEEIWELHQNKGTLNFKFYFCSNKETLVEAAKTRLESSLKQFVYVDFYYYDLDQFVNKLLENKFKKINGEINFVDTDYFDRSDGSLRTIVATVAATDLIRLVSDQSDGQKIEESAFDDNCRIYKGTKTNEINKKIYESALSEDNYKFYYLNNGVTIICESIDYPPKTRHPLAKLTNFQVVNGGQTTHALFEASKENSDQINNVLVLARICITNDRDLVEKISETTNNQTPVTNRDLRSNDEIQKKLEAQFEQAGYFYERKKNLYAEQPKEKRLDSELMGQLYLAFYSDKPAEAKNQKAKIFGEWYEDIFDEKDMTADRLLLPYKIYLPLETKKKSIQASKRKKIAVPLSESFIPHATFYLINTVKFIADMEKLDLTDEEVLNYALSKAIVNVGKVVSEKSESLGADYSHSKFFKEVANKDVIQNYLLDNVYKGDH